MSENYVKVDVLKYVKEGLESGILVPFEAEKFARPHIRHGVVGEEIISWSEDKDGNPVMEKVAVVKLDEKTGKPGWVVTKTDENGVPVVDRHGHLNQWIITDSQYHSKYEPCFEIGEGIHKPVGGPQIFVQIPDNIILQQWGKEMMIGAGGYINITKIDDMYGISGRDYDDTYKRTSRVIKTYKIQ